MNEAEVATTSVIQVSSNDSRVSNAFAGLVSNSGSLQAGGLVIPAFTQIPTELTHKHETSREEEVVGAVYLDRGESGQLGQRRTPEGLGFRAVQMTAGRSP